MSEEFINLMRNGTVEQLRAHRLKQIKNHRLQRRANFDMEQVNVRIVSLLESLRKNREKHKDTFLKARDGYREEAKKLFGEQLRLAEEGFSFRHYVHLDPPQNHTKDYDQAIQMLEMELDAQVVSGRATFDGSSTDEDRAEMATIDISRKDFANFVRDDWGWKDEWISNTTRYIVS